MVKCPCENCICVPICKHKTFYKLFYDCIYLRIYEPGYLIREERCLERIYGIQNILKSTVWIYEYSPSLVNYSVQSVVKIRGKELDD